MSYVICYLGHINLMMMMTMCGK